MTSTILTLRLKRDLSKTLAETCQIWYYHAICNILQIITLLALRSCILERSRLVVAHAHNIILVYFRLILQNRPESRRR